MATITITKQEFEDFLPVATTPDNQTGIYNNVSKAFPDAYDTVINRYLGEELAENFELLSPVMQSLIKEIVSLTAFLRVFRQLDLVLTSTGFGIVSNNNVAPASKERVDALYQDIFRQLDRRTENLLEILIKTKDWGTTVQAAGSLDCLFWKRSLAESYLGKANPSHEEWIRLRNRARDVEFDAVSRKISYEQLHTLHVAMRNNTTTDKQLELTRKILQFIAYVVGDATLSAKMALDDMVDYANKNVDDFPEYKTSAAYMINNDRGYQNAQQDPTFFFK